MKISLGRSLCLFFLTVFVSGCAITDEHYYAPYSSLLSDTAGYAKLDDSFRGYRVEFYSMPAGALITCSGKNYGLSPLRKWFSISDEEKDGKYFSVDDCVALWKSGARREFSQSIPLDMFPNYSVLTIERPVDHPGELTDKEFAEQYIPHQRAEYAAAIASLGAFVGQVATLKNMLDDSNDVAAPPKVNVTGPSLGVAYPKGGVQWNWVKIPDLNAGMAKVDINSLSSDTNNMIPLLPASSCLGSVFMGECKGGAVDIRPSERSYCLSKFVNGRCLGPIVFGR